MYVLQRNCCNNAYKASRRGNIYIALYCVDNPIKMHLFQEEEESPLGRNPLVSSITHHSIMFAPKCLVLVSRLDYIETFRVNLINNLIKNLLFFC